MPFAPLSPQLRDCSFGGERRAAGAAPPLLDGVPFSTAYYSDDGRLLRLSPASDGIFRLKTPLSGIAKEAVIATVFYEDRYFRKHPGVNPFALVRAAFATFTGSRPIGASTITMQVARLRLHLETRSLEGKFRQIEAALRYEAHYSKDEILEAYLNLAPYGGNIEGVGAAARLTSIRTPPHSRRANPWGSRSCRRIP